MPIVIVNLIIHYKNKLDIDLYLIGTTQLKQAIAIATKFNKIQTLRIPPNSVTFLKKLADVSKKVKFFSKHTSSSELELFGWYFMEIFNALFNLEYLYFGYVIKRIDKLRIEMEQLFQYIGEIDSAISLASVYNSNLPICAPDFIENKRIDVEHVIHPLVNDCVPNSLKLEQQGLLLTGSNMSGKTTFIRSIAINTVLGQAFNICFAKKFQIPYAKLYSCIRIADSVLDNTSYYLKEVLFIKPMTDAATNRNCLFILDEILKGTNTQERIAGGKAILSYLVKNTNLVIVATHDIELAQMLSSKSFTVYHFEEQVSNGKLTFDYKLKEGKKMAGNAIRILELYGFPNEVINEASILTDSKKTKK